MLFRKLGWMDEVFAAKMNKFVFLVPLPVLLFEQLATVDFSEVWDIKFILFCFVVTAISITISTLISLLWKDRSVKGEFIQATYRSSAALLGIAFIQNIYGTAGMAPLMIIGSVPLYNIMAVASSPSHISRTKNRSEALMIQKLICAGIMGSEKLSICRHSFLLMPFSST